MHQRVTAILVVHSGAAYLRRTLAALSAQTQRPEATLVADVGSVDGSREMLATLAGARLVAAPERSSFGSAVSHALSLAAPDANDGEWLWLLRHDSAPDPDALARLLAAVEVAPSVAVAGPKLGLWDAPAVIGDFGTSMTTLGATVSLVAGELDQGQHDTTADVLAVAEAGMLVRRSVWEALGGFDPALPATDDALDFCVRARLAGHRVIRVAGARVFTAGGPELFGRVTSSAHRRARLARTAQLHRRLAYAPVLALPLHWLSLLPLAILRSLGHLLAKRPGLIGGEIAAALAAAVSFRAVASSRRRIRRSRVVGWSAIAPLRISAREAGRRRAHGHEVDGAGVDGAGVGSAGVDGAGEREPAELPGFFSGGGVWALVIAALVGTVAFGSLFGAPSLTGGGVLPLAPTVAGLWANVGPGIRSSGDVLIGFADPFIMIVAVLGSITWWQPSLSIVVLFCAALPLAALSAWFCARRTSSSAWVPFVLAILWACAPPFLEALAAGRPGAVISHIALPWLMLLVRLGVRSWGAASGAALVFAIILGCTPSLAPALLIGWVLVVALNGRAAVRLAGIPLPALVLLAPVAVEQYLRGTPLGILADPGVPVSFPSPSALQLALGSTDAGSLGWGPLLGRLLLSTAAAPYVAALLLLPLAIVITVALFGRFPRRLAPPLVIALLGFVTAAAASQVAVSATGAIAVALWPGAGLSLYWLGLLGVAGIALDAVASRARGVSVLVGVATVLAVIPLLSAVALGTSQLSPGRERLLPAVVDAEAELSPSVGTLVIDPVGSNAIAVALERGRGTTLDDQSTLDATASGAPERGLAALAANLSSVSGHDASDELDSLGIRFVLLREPSASTGEVGAGADDRLAAFNRSRDSLDRNPILSPVGSTDLGLLWRYAGLPSSSADPSSAGPSSGVPVSPDQALSTAIHLGVLIAQGAVIGIALLLAFPTGRRTHHARSRRPGELLAEEIDE